MINYVSHEENNYGKKFENYYQNKKIIYLSIRKKEDDIRPIHHRFLDLYMLKINIR